MSNVVYLDDEVELTNIFQLFMEDFGFQVNVFNEEQQAISFCTKNSPEIIFIDYRLTSMKGDEVAKLLPEEAAKVLVTGDLSVETDFKFDAMVQKPFKLAEIVDTVKQLASSSHQA